jgi:uncharacterized protein YukE
MTIGLTYGEPTSAARTIVESIEPLREILTTTSEQIEAAAPGFTGKAAVGLSEALSAWFGVASTLEPILQEYATALATVDQTHAANDLAQQQSYQQLRERIGGAQ